MTALATPHCLRREREIILSPRERPGLVRGGGPGYRSVGGFTLVELLAVIAVIGLLAAILIPTITAVRQSMNVAQASSDVRQLAGAVSLYTVENDGDYPVGYANIPQEGTNYERAGHVWYEATGRILYPGIREAVDSLKPWMWRFYPTGYENTVYMSPSAESDHSSIVPSYAYNDTLVGKVGGMRKLALFFSPAETVMLADCSGASHSLSTSSESTQLNARHGASNPYARDGKAIVAYLEGHIQVLTAEECTELNDDPDNVFWGVEQ
ncbi:MAG: prepilin-type N-terminal cleavage/methylation domain-containing protein [Verrucomicrobiota bacterium JB024]|nr:prepilin-type N-terminal cleavage/methylation domain-containing protein [Verrucomicrobiota bacterium JB024]